MLVAGMGGHRRQGEPVNAHDENEREFIRAAEEQAALRRVATLIAAGVADRQLIVAVTHEIGRVLVAVGVFEIEHPPDVREPETFAESAHRRPEPPRRMRIAVAIAECVVAAVVGDPADHRSFDRHRAGDRQRHAQGPVGLERAVGEQPVVTDGDAEARDDVERQEQHHVRPAESPAPGDRNSRQERQERHDHERVERELFAALLGSLENRLGGRALVEQGHRCLSSLGRLRNQWLRNRNLRIRRAQVVLSVSRLDGRVSAAIAGWGNWQPAGLWSRAVWVRVPVPQHSPPSKGPPWRRLP